ncbi:hypothetical protein GE061_018587 [Apolygus lucorum]|uniref:Uncharacterized protein n=1 Tax=Apolygus lucorum TaxID=248454 RepID=A0A8S9XH21_APOLU|nr:hypothetical protein GE061_018587 [Apolygus lucorum]
MKGTQTLNYHLLEYVTTLCFIYRLYAVTSASGTCTDIPDFDRLRTAVSSILLPGILADYVESLGVIRFSSGANVVPWCDSIDRLFGAPGFRSTFATLNDAGRPTVHNLWGIDPLYQMEWTTLAVRNSSKAS